jgi:hypothetical protein
VWLPRIEQAAREILQAFFELQSSFFTSHLKENTGLNSLRLNANIRYPPDSSATDLRQKVSSTYIATKAVPQQKVAPKLLYNSVAFA